jgi:tetratricopeptide (TPR) repeat protein
MKHTRQHSLQRKCPTQGRKTGPGTVLYMLLGALMLATGSCQGPVNVHEVSGSSPQAASEEAVAETPGETVALDAGSYLVAHVASYGLDLRKAADNYALALAKDPSNIALLERSFLMFYINGEIENAATIAGRIEQISEPVELGGEPAAAIAARNGDWEGLDVLAEHLWADEASRPMGIVLSAWSLAFREQGDAGLSRLLDMATIDHHGAEVTMLVQSALMAEYLGRPGEANAFAGDVLNTASIPPASRILMAGILARSGKLQDALDQLDPSLGPFFDKPAIRRDLENGELLLLPTPSRRQILANAIIDASQLDDSEHIHLLARLHLASYIDPGYDRLIYMLGRELFNLGYDDQAQRQFALMPQNSIWRQPGLILTARQLSRQKDSTEDAALIYDKLIENNPDNPSLLQYAADNDRWAGKFDTALIKYDTALDLAPASGRLHYYRGICLDHLRREDEAEKAFRLAISFDPEDAYALNYFGYWLLEQDKAPAEALGMIRKAVKKQPRNGYFVDSLGWGLFKLGRYDKAVLYLEQAVTLEPADPVITDHLGDAYAKLGRMREARYHWQRALVFANDDTDTEEIRQKIRATLKEE